MYGVNTTNLAWFTSYLNGRKQYIKITEYAATVKKRYQAWHAAMLNTSNVIFVACKRSQ